MTAPLRAAAVAWPALFLLAFLAAPRARGWGLSACTIAAGLLAVVLFVVALGSDRHIATVRRTLLGLAALTAGVWLGGAVRGRYPENVPALLMRPIRTGGAG